LNKAAFYINIFKLVMFCCRIHRPGRDMNIMEEKKTRKFNQKENGKIRFEFSNKDELD
jgi:hypothetical protein